MSCVAVGSAPPAGGYGPGGGNDVGGWEAAGGAAGGAAVPERMGRPQPSQPGRQRIVLLERQRRIWSNTPSGSSGGTVYQHAYFISAWTVRQRWLTHPSILIKAFLSRSSDER